MRQAAFCLVLLLAAALATAAEPLSRIAFGSCAKEDKPQPIWEQVIATKPQLFLFIGDNIYGDTDDMNILRAKYAMLGAQPGYQALLKVCPVLATWDDHDYGRNDAGADYEHRAGSQQVFCDFFGVPATSPRRQREGIYDVAYFGPEGKRVQVILLDTRYFRSSPLKQRTKEERKALKLGPYAPDADPARTMLGEAQWKWLDETLRQPADLRIIASSIQVVSGEHGWETWGEMPAERQRLLDLIARTGANGVVFISGDRHLGELSCYTGGPYPLYDVTSSGMNQGGGGRADEPNPHRVKPMYRGENFGTITVDWQAADPVIALRVHDAAGKPVIEQMVNLSTLRAR